MQWFLRILTAVLLFLFTGRGELRAYEKAPAAPLPAARAVERAGHGSLGTVQHLRLQAIRSNHAIEEPRGIRIDVPGSEEEDEDDDHGPSSRTLKGKPAHLPLFVLPVCGAFRERQRFRPSAVRSGAPASCSRHIFLCVIRR